MPYAMEEAFRRDHMTCYDMALTPAMRSGPEIEAQVEQLKALEAEGKLTTEAARKAAAALALQAEYLAQGALAGTPGAAHIKPGAGAQKAGEQLVEMTVDRPGMLGGVPPSAGTTERGKEGAR
ncbi:MAG: hypothetical protein FJX75_04270 [Armatimonadetes bacterium]|nr:hypothetical protein [Armatimonadota bacterium]